MKASAIYDTLQNKVDQLQKDMKNAVRDQLVMAQTLENTQARMKDLMQIVIKEGDRELSSEEVQSICE